MTDLRPNEYPNAHVAYNDIFPYDIENRVTIKLIKKDSPNAIYKQLSYLELFHSS